MFDAPALPVQHWAPEEHGHSERLAPAAGRNGERSTRPTDQVEKGVSTLGVHLQNCNL